MSDPEGVAAALEEAQQKNPHMCSLHNAHCLGISVGSSIVPGYSGATVNDNPYMILPSDPVGRKAWDEMMIIIIIIYNANYIQIL